MFLPAEIRNMIWIRVVPEREHYALDHECDHETKHFRRKEHRPQAGLLHVCRQCFDEVSSIEMQKTLEVDHEFNLEHRAIDKVGSGVDEVVFTIELFSKHKISEGNMAEILF
jgi:hypothetical protein